MAVRIENMDIPKSCFECKLLKSVENNAYWFCYATKVCLYKEDDLEKRQSWCPLKECE